ncbi:MULTISPECIES: alpha/beta hydrolase family protein [Microbacterium]|uniref:alpha/beta hydrolase family protein n=1 Tax=Microbacterium TaxID=33882 RepID=UPI00217CCCAF|nr:MULTISPECIES: alpha/beta family hydrolase [Microbacterium]UWF78137.1 dienelactone hydrolase family protein [Microbacterium neungamense]WCM56314.1 dienelactone hydrolase family protein [Microbacterium sp. EF45047]
MDVSLPSGVVAVSTAWAAPDGASRGTVVIAHGAGAGMDHPFLIGFASALTDAGFATLRFNFPYVEAGRRMPGPAAHAIATWRAAVAMAAEQDPDVRIWACGKSYGGRMASMAVAEGMPVAGLVYLGYPLHPPGQPEKLRVEHLPAIAVPQLFVEGTNDPFVQPLSQLEEAVAACQDARIAWVEGGGHSFEVKGRKRPPAEVGASLAPIVAEFAG